MRAWLLLVPPLCATALPPPGPFVPSGSGRAQVDPVPPRDDTLKGSGIPGLTFFSLSQHHPTLHRG